MCGGPWMIHQRFGARLSWDGSLRRPGIGDLSLMNALDRGGADSEEGDQQ